MKKLTLILGLVLLVFAGCKKDEGTTTPDQDKPNNSIPDVECTVNGKDWKLNKNDSFNNEGMADNRAPSIIVTKNGRNLSFSIHKWDATDTAVIVATVYVNEGLAMLGTYEFDFANDDENKHYIRYMKLDRSMGPPAEMINSVGFFKITGHSPDAKTISGEFEVDVTNLQFSPPPPQNTTISIKKGKFTNISYKE